MKITSLPYLLILCAFLLLGCGTLPNNLGSACDPTKTICTDIEDWCSVVDKHVDTVETNLSVDVEPFVFEPVQRDTILEQTGSSLEFVEAAISVAEALCQKASEAEPSITHDLVELVKQSAGSMYGLDHRMKQPTSLARKLITEYNQAIKDGLEDTSLESIASTINDTVRYTAIFSLEGLAAGYTAVHEGLQNMGYTRESVLNFFEIYESDKESRIKAIHTFYRTQAGFLFELQFQTVETQSAYDLTHPMYEKGRADTTSSEERKTLFALAREVYACVPTNEALLAIE